MSIHKIFIYRPSLRIEFDGGRGPSFLVVPLVFEPGKHKDVSVIVEPSEGVFFENSVQVGDALRAVFTTARSINLGASFFGSASFTQEGSKAEPVYQVTYTEDFRSIIFELREIEISSRPVGIQLAFPVAKYAPKNACKAETFATVKLYTNNQEIDTMVVPRAIHPNAGRILVVGTENDSNSPTMSWISETAKVLGRVRGEFIILSKMFQWGSDECMKWLNEGCDGIHVLGGVNYREILIGDQFLSSESFFDTLRRSGIKLLYLDQCNSVQLVGEARNAGIKALIAATESLEVTYGNWFAYSFYTALGQGCFVSEAFAEAKNGVNLSGLSDKTAIIYSPSKTRSGYYEPMFLDLHSDFRFGEV